MDFTAHINTFISNLPAYIAMGTAVAVALGGLGGALSKIPYKPLQYVGGILTSVYSHWGDIAAAVKPAPKADK